MMPVRLGSVGYLNARPCVVGLERHPRFDLRFDVPSRCAALLHEGAIDVGFIPSIEYLRGPAPYRIVPDVAIVSFGPVASVSLFTTRAIRDVRSIALDTSSRSSVALTRVLCARAFRIDPAFENSAPDLLAMLDRCDAALLIGDDALLVDPAMVRLKRDSVYGERRVRLKADSADERSVVTTETAEAGVEKIDLGDVWSKLTGLPFVYAFWAGRPDALTADEVEILQRARDRGVGAPERVARDYFGDPVLQEIGARYLRDNIKYYLGESERAGLETFYRYAAELGLVPRPLELVFY